MMLRAPHCKPLPERIGPRCRVLEYHHRHPFAAGGKATLENIELRCRAHNGSLEVATFLLWRRRVGRPVVSSTPGLLPPR